jgi:hypothetical protein
MVSNQFQVVLVFLEPAASADFLAAADRALPTSVCSKIIFSIFLKLVCFSF